MIVHGENFGHAIVRLASGPGPRSDGLNRIRILAQHLAGTVQARDAHDGAVIGRGQRAILVQGRFHAQPQALAIAGKRQRFKRHVVARADFFLRDIEHGRCRQGGQVTAAAIGVAHERVQAHLAVAFAAVPQAAILRIDADGFDVGHLVAPVQLGMRQVRIAAAVGLREEMHAVQGHARKRLAVIVQGSAVEAGRIDFRAVIAFHHPALVGRIVIDAGQAAHRGALERVFERDALFADQAQAGNRRVVGEAGAGGEDNGGGCQGKRGAEKSVHGRYQ
ncbi:hypothetical protein D3C72_1327810 [compost metagenome]